MIARESLLVLLVRLVDRVPEPPPAPRRRGSPTYYGDRLFLKALIVMTVRRIHSVSGLLGVLEQPSPEMQTLRQFFTQAGRFPCRRTWERRLKALPATLPARIAGLGRHLVSLIEPWAECGRAVAIDSTTRRARGRGSADG